MEFINIWSLGFVWGIVFCASMYHLVGEQHLTAFEVWACAAIINPICFVIYFAAMPLVWLSLVPMLIRSTSHAYIGLRKHRKGKL